MKNIIVKQTCLGLVIVYSLISTSVIAEEAVTDVSVYAGLEPVMELECSDMNFGVYQVARGDRGIGTAAFTTIQMSIGVDRNNNEEVRISFLNAGQDQIALSDKPEYDPPQPAVCLVTGARVKNGSLTVTRDPAAGSIEFSGVSANPFATNLMNPITSATGIIGFFTVPTSVTTDLNGDAEFNIVGEIDIPNNLVADNYGSYKAGPLTVTVSDGL